MRFYVLLGSMFLAFTSSAFAEEWKCTFLYGFEKNADKAIQEIPNNNFPAYFSIKDRKLAIVDKWRREFPMIFDQEVIGNGSRIYKLTFSNVALIIQLKGEYEKGSHAKMRMIENSDDDYLVVQNFDCLRDF